jgi:hypothetical protein
MHVASRFARNCREITGNFMPRKACLSEVSLKQLSRGNSRGCRRIEGTSSILEQNLRGREDHAHPLIIVVITIIVIGRRCGHAIQLHQVGLKPGQLLTLIIE